MKEMFSSRAVLLGEYIIDTGATVRAAAKVFKISKSTVHKDITVKLKYEEPALYLLVRDVLEKNKQERHIRGGLATREKYLGRHQN
ncbi:MAG: sporulation transcriptional regulator SpoIIID [Clostridia bacterium]|nr:sporulation transcriptional regulator SpoIIID [Clostridia bacterium]